MFEEMGSALFGLGVAGLIGIGLAIVLAYFSFRSSNHKEGKTE